MSQAQRLPIKGAGKLEPWSVPDYDLEDAAAIQALYRGSATEEQQRHAFGYIVQKLCAIGDPEFRPPEVDPDGRVSAFAGGKRWVGLQLAKFAQLNLAVLRRRQSNGKPQPTEQPT